MGFAFSPSFTETGLFYVSYVIPGESVSSMGSERNERKRYDDANTTNQPLSLYTYITYMRFMKPTHVKRQNVY